MLHTVEFGQVSQAQNVGSYKAGIGNFPFHGIVVRPKLNKACKIFSTVPGMKGPPNNLSLVGGKACNW